MKGTTLYCGSEMGEERLISMSCHLARQKLALEVGATGIVALRIASSSRQPGDG
jgi:hypothetical protein